MKEIDSLQEIEINEKVYIKGFFKRCIYENEEGNYFVYSFQAEKIIVKGIEYNFGEKITTIALRKEKLNFDSMIHGNIEEYKGRKKDLQGTRNVKVFTVNYIEPQTKEKIIEFLNSGFIKGLTKKMVEKIVIGYKDKKKNWVKGFEENTLEIIKNDHKKLLNIPRMTIEKAEKIHEQYMENIIYEQVFEYFSQFGLSENLITKIYNEYGFYSIELSKTNPYKFSTIYRISFKICDNLSAKFGLDPHSKNRIEAGIFHILTEAESDGHCFLPENILIDKVENLLRIVIQKSELKKLEKIYYYENLRYELSESEIEQIKQTCILDSVISEEIKKVLNSMVSSGSLTKVENYIYKTSIYLMEQNVANDIIRLNKKTISLTEEREKEINKYIEDFESLKEIKLEEQQKKAVLESCQTSFLVLTGGAGSGKTTTIEAIIYVYKELNKNSNFMLTAPTGRASKRMTEVTKCEAKTIHRLLEFSPSDGFGFNRDNQLKYKMIIVDETSMISLKLIASFLEAVNDDCSLIFVGDVEQLPSIGAGNFLKNIIDSGFVNVVRLDVIKRQLENSGIINNAKKIINNQMPCSMNEDFFVIKVETMEEIRTKILKSIKRFLEKGESIDDIQIILPQKTTAIGTINLNAEVQSLVNPPSVSNTSSTKEIQYGKTIFRVGDRVVHLKNDYEAEQYQYNATKNIYIENGKGVFNGDIGKVVDIKDGKLIVKYDKFYIFYEKSHLDELQLAYCLTVHKMQGSQAKIVIAGIHTAHFSTLNKNLGYTLVTRAERIVVLVANNKGLWLMTNTEESNKRYTRLEKLLQKQKLCVI